MSRYMFSEFTLRNVPNTRMLNYLETTFSIQNISRNINKLTISKSLLLIEGNNSLRPIRDPLREPFLLLVSHPLTSTSLSFIFSIPTSCFFQTIERNSEWLCSVSHSNNLFTQKREIKRSIALTVKHLHNLPFARLSQREKNHSTYSNMGNKGKKAKCLRKHWRRCFLIEIGYNGELCWCLKFLIFLINLL